MGFFVPGLFPAAGVSVGRAAEVDVTSPPLLPFFPPDPVETGRGTVDEVFESFPPFPPSPVETGREAVDEVFRSFPPFPPFPVEIGREAMDEVFESFPPFPVEVGRTVEVELRTEEEVGDEAGPATEDERALLLFPSSVTVI